MSNELLFKTYDNRDKIHRICETMINSIPLHYKTPKSRLLKIKEKVNYGKNSQVYEMLEGLFKNLRKDQDGKVFCTDLIEDLISLGIGLEPLLFGKVMKK